jgi:hypothetical protein
MDITLFPTYPDGISAGKAELLKFGAEAVAFGAGFEGGLALWAIKAEAGSKMANNSKYLKGRLQNRAQVYPDYAWTGIFSSILPKTMSNASSAECPATDWLGGIPCNQLQKTFVAGGAGNDTATSRSTQMKRDALSRVKSHSALDKWLNIVLWCRAVPRVNCRIGSFLSHTR